MNAGVHPVAHAAQALFFLSAVHLFHGLADRIFVEPVACCTALIRSDTSAVMTSPSLLENDVQTALRAKAG